MTKKTQKWVPTDRATFEAMDVVGKRKAITGDLLAGIAAEVLAGCVAGYVTSAAPSEYGEFPDGAVDEVVANLTKCYVCGIGAPLIAAGRIADRLGDYLRYGMPGGGTGGVFEYLSQWFPVATLELVEFAYEAGAGAVPYVEADEREFALSFSAHDYGTPRLKAIWEHVANHPEGLFAPLPE